MSPRRPRPATARPRALRPARRSGDVATADPGTRRPRRPAKPGLSVQTRGAARVLRRRRTGQGHRPRLPRQRGDRDHRPLGLRQVDDGPLHQPHARGDPGRARRGQGAARRPRRVRLLGRRRRGAPRDRHGLPEAEPVPDDVDLRQRRLRPAAQLARARRPAPRRSRRRCAAPGCGTRSQTACPSPAPGSPAASSSGCASRARSPSTPR